MDLVIYQSGLPIDQSKFVKWKQMLRAREMVSSYSLFIPQCSDAIHLHWGPEKKLSCFTTRAIIIFGDTYVHSQSKIAAMTALFTLFTIAAILEDARMLESENE